MDLKPESKPVFINLQMSVHQEMVTTKVQMDHVVSRGHGICFHLIELTEAYK